MARRDRTYRKSTLSASEARLLEKFWQGDEASFESLFQSHYPRVYALLLRLVGTEAEAEDLAQDVFIQLYRHPLRPGREHNLAAWLYRVATNLGYNALRSEKRLAARREALARESLAEAPLHSAPDPATEALRAEERAQVRAVLTQLPLPQAQLLFLRQAGFSYKELAEILEVAPGSIGTLLARAERAFAEVWEKLMRDS